MCIQAYKMAAVSLKNGGVCGTVYELLIRGYAGVIWVWVLFVRISCARMWEIYSGVSESACRIWLC